MDESTVAAGSTLVVTSALTGIMESVWASLRKRPRRWMTTSVQNVNELRREAQRSSTASAELPTTSHSNHTPAVSSHLFQKVHVEACFLIRSCLLLRQVLHRLRSLSELVPRALRGHPTERSHTYRRVCVPAVPVYRGCHDGPDATHR